MANERATTLANDLPNFATPHNSNVTLVFSGLGMDDRGVLELNGQVIGNTGLGGAGTPAIAWQEGQADQAYTYTNVTAGTKSQGFLLGGLNTLTLIVNNTDDGIYGTTKTLQSSSDLTWAGVDATLSYTLPDTLIPPPAPEPASLALFGIGAVGLLALRRKS